MIIKFTDEFINNIRNSCFPIEQEIQINKLYLQSKGQDTSLSYQFIINNNRKIIDDTKSKNIKLIIFYPLYVNNDTTIDQVFDTGDVKQIVNFIRNFCPIYKDINITSEYNSVSGEKYIYDIDMPFASFFSKKLDNDFKNNQSQINYLFYYDKLEDVVEEKLVDLRTMYTDMLFTAFNKDNCLDKRVINNIFKSSLFTQQILNTIQTTDKINILPEKINSSPSNPYFSNLFISRNTNDNFSFVFSLDEKSFFTENASPIFKNIISSNAESAFTVLKQNNKIKNINIYKRKIDRVQYNKPKDKEIVPLYDTNELLLTASLNNSLLEGKNDNCELYERDVKFSLDNIRSFEFTDKTYNKIFRGQYQYGVEIIVENKYIQELKNQILSVNNSLNDVNKYYEYTSLNKPNTNTFYYDINLKSFTNLFANSNEYLAIKPLLTTNIEIFISLLKIFGIYQKISSIYQDIDLKLLFNSMLLADTATAESISEYIKIVQQVLTYANKLISNDKSNTYSYTYWFYNNIADSELPRRTGYVFLNSINNSNLLFNIKSGDMSQQISIDAQKFVGSADTIASGIQDEKYSFISPTNILFNKENIDLKDSNKYNIKLYNNLEINIQNFILSTTDKLDVNIKNSFPLSNTTNEKAKDTNPLGINGFSVSNLYSKLSNTEFLKKEKVNSKIDNLLLMLNRAYKINDLKSNPLDENAVMFDTSVPYQIRDLLYSKSSKVLPSTYKKDVNLLSKFYFFYNTIHRIEFLDFESGGVKNEKWTTLTKTNFDQFISLKKYLCRLNVYQSDKAGVNHFHKIKLPIYNEYFFIENGFNTSNLLNVIATSPTFNNRGKQLKPKKMIDPKWWPYIVDKDYHPSTNVLQAIPANSVIRKGQIIAKDNLSAKQAFDLSNPNYNGYESYDTDLSIQPSQCSPDKVYIQGNCYSVEDNSPLYITTYK